MIYLVSRNKALFESNSYEDVSFSKALEVLEPLEVVQIDTETSGLDCHTKKLLTLQLGCTKDQVVFDWATLLKEERIQLKEYLESDRLLIGHNLAFDLTFLYKQNIWPKNIYDTMIAEQLIYLGFPRILGYDLVEELGIDFPGYEDTGKNLELSMSLKSTANRRININIDKTVRGKIINEGLTEEVVIYAAGDVKYLEDIRNVQLIELEKQDLINATKFECEFIKSLAYEKYCGIHLEPSRWRAKMEQDKEELDKSIDELNKYVIELDSQEYIYREIENPSDRLKLLDLGFEEYDYNKFKYKIKGKFVHINRQLSLFEEFDDTGPVCDINWSSSKQVIPLFELLGIKVKTFDKKTKKEKKSIDNKQLAPQVNDFPILKIFSRYQAAAKVVSTYGENWLNAINEKTGRIHAELHVIGTDTSRISSGGGVYQINLLNLPRDHDTRACFTAEEGNLWISCDYEGQESVLTASVSQDAKMLEILNTGGDMHSTVAKLCWPRIIGDTPIEEIKHKFKDIRQDAKGCEFGILYGGDYNTLHANKGIPLDEAKEVYNNFMKGFSGIADYQDYCRKIVMKKGYILMNNVFGHRAHIYDFEWLDQIQKKTEEPGFWPYYNELKKYNPSSSIVKAIKRYFKRKSESERASINYRVQNRGACSFKLAMIKLFNWICKNNYQNIIKIVVTPYDEINLEVPSDMAEDVGKILIKCMEEGGKPFCKNVTLTADMSRNPDGSLPNYWLH